METCRTPTEIWVSAPRPRVLEMVMRRRRRDLGGRLETTNHQRKVFQDGARMGTKTQSKEALVPVLHSDGARAAREGLHHGDSGGRVLVGSPSNGDG